MASAATGGQAGIEIRPLADGISFGARISGITFEALANEDTRQAIRDAFEERGVIVFEDVEQSGKMQIALSEVFGPLKEFPLPSVDHVNDDRESGIIDLTFTPDKPGARMGMVEVDGNVRHSWLPWHFDHCYNDTLNRAGVLRASVLPPEGGETLFADGIELYRALSPDLRERIEGRNVIYSLANIPLETIRFGRTDFRLHHRDADGHAAILEQARTTPRAIHPAVWKRGDGQKVLHLCGYFACGLEGDETQEGDALLDAVCHEVNRLADASAYTHVWQGTEMLIWDNWRMLHHAAGADPRYTRSMQRSTILGDYNLGRFETDPGIGKRENAS